MTEPDTAIACNLGAIAPDNLAPHIATGTDLLASSQEVRALPNGYAFRLPTETASLHQSAAFIANERLCCPFFQFVLEVEPHQGAIWLRLTGPEGAKALLEAELVPRLAPAVAAAAGIAVEPTKAKGEG